MLSSAVKVFGENVAPSRARGSVGSWPSLRTRVEGVYMGWAGWLGGDRSRWPNHQEPLGVGDGQLSLRSVEPTCRTRSPNYKGWCELVSTQSHRGWQRVPKHDTRWSWLRCWRRSGARVVASATAWLLPPRFILSWSGGILRIRADRRLLMIARVAGWSMDSRWGPPA